MGERVAIRREILALIGYLPCIVWGHRLKHTAKKYITWTSSFFGLLLILAGCSFLPLPMTIDLKARLGSQTSGSVQQEIGAGEVDDVDFRHPDENGECIDFEDADIPVTVRSARLNYNASTDYEGPRLTGKVTAQLYVSNTQSSLWDASNKVGPEVSVNLNDPDTRLAGTAVLNRDQIAGINEKYLCWGLRVTGSDVSAIESDEATIEYRIDQLRLDIRFSVV